MNQMQSFIEKIKNDKDLMTKLDALGAGGAEPEADKIVAIAAEHGFAITAEDYQQALEQAAVQKSGELAEEDLDAVAGGATENRWDPNRCNQHTEVAYDCRGLLGWVRCDHFHISKAEGGQRVKCAMGRFDYVESAGIC